MKNTFERSTKNDKIYNKKDNCDAMAQIYKSSNNSKLTNTGGTSKSVDKPAKKYTCNHFYTNNMSLEKHHNKDILMKTEAKGFFI